MMQKNYRIRFLQSFYDDAEEITNYITYTLCNPYAARRFVLNMENAIEERSRNPEIYAVYACSMNEGTPYYRIIVGNFIVLYVVLTEDDEKIMEVRRVLYGRRNIPLLLFDEKV